MRKFDGDPNRLEVVVELDRIENSPGRGCRKFLDLKKPFKLRKLIHSSPDSQFRIYWLSVLDLIGKERNCWHRKECINENECVIIHSFGRNFLETINQYINQSSPHSIAQMVDDICRDEWEYIGDKVISWGCASEPIRALGEYQN